MHSSRMSSECLLVPELESGQACAWYWLFAMHACTFALYDAISAGESFLTFEAFMPKSSGRMGILKTSILSTA